MQFEALKVFCDVVRHHSFSRAAAANHISQSAASQIVSQLERRIGVRLIDRSTRPLHPTVLGKVYYEGCRELVEQYLELESSIRQAQSQMATTVRVAAIYSVGLSDMGQLVDRFRSIQPSASVQVEYLHPDQVYEHVLEGEADLGLVSFPRRSREWAVLPWREEEMVLVCAPTQPLAELPEISIEQISSQAYVGFTRDLRIRRQVDRFVRSAGFQLNVRLEFDNIENIKSAIESGAGVALLPSPTVCKEVQAGSLVARPLAGCKMVRPLGIIHRRNQRLGASVQRFIDLLRGATESPCSLPSSVPPPQIEPGDDSGTNGVHVPISQGNS